MATYYVKTATDGGSDSNNGTSAATAWASVGKALSSTGIADTTIANTVYVAPGVYRGLLNPTMTVATAEQKFMADLDGSHFSGVVPGDVRVSAYTSDSSAPSGTTLFQLNTRSNITFDGLKFIGSNNAASCFSNTAGCINITFRRCYFVGGRAGGVLVTLTPKVQASSNWLFDQCVFDMFGTSNCINISAVSQTTGADWDCDILIQNSLFIGGNATMINFTSTGGNTFKPGGVDVINCTIMGAVQSSNTSTSIPMTVTNCILRGASVLLNAGASGQIVEDYNVLYGGATPRTNVTVGTNSTPTPSAQEFLYAPLFETPHNQIIGFMPRPLFTPAVGSPLLGLGTLTGAPATDMLGRMRPAGGGSTNPTIGALERHDTAVKGTVITPDAGSNIEITGPGDHDFDLPVNTSATTINVKVRTSGYSGTNYPQMLIVNGGEAGVADASVSATSASASGYETISIGPFTPTSLGIITVRLTNRTGNTTGVAAFDTFSVS